MEYGYARVSTREQNDERQHIALTAFGITPRAIFVDKQSGRDFDRTQYQRLMRRLKKDDTIVVKSIDRWAGTTPRSSNSGASSPRTNRPPSSCWTCPCSTRGAPAA